MHVKIRLGRVGTNKQACYRLVVADCRAPRDGRFIEKLGYYNPRTDPATIEVDVEKAQLWLSRGAQPTDIARALLKKKGLLGGVASAEAPAKAAKAAKKAEEAAPETSAEVPAESPESEAPAEE